MKLPILHPVWSYKNGNFTWLCLIYLGLLPTFIEGNAQFQRDISETEDYFSSSTSSSSFFKFFQGSLGERDLESPGWWLIQVRGGWGGRPLFDQGLPARPSPGASDQRGSLLPAGSLFPQLKPSESVFKVIFWLGYFNSCVNPLIYPCSSREFKRAFLRLLRCQCRRRRRRRPLWRVYGHHWRASPGGLRPDCASGRDAAPPGAPLALTAPSAPGSPGKPEGQGPVAGRRKPPCAFREWRLLGPLRRPTTQLRAKVSSLSHKIRPGSAQRAEASCNLRAEVEAVSLGVPHEVAEGATCQAYELADYGNLRETDI